MLRLTLPLLGLLPGAAAWGRDGHKITAQVAQALLSEDEVSRATSILGGDDLAAVANWADEIRDDDEWKWTEASHFINTPDGQCSFDYNRDCKDRDGKPDYCVAGAILNYTAYLLSGTEDQDMMQIALKFIVHFAGDIHQPLHVGWTTDQGGNKIHVEDSWEDDKERNLHQVWDEGLINGIEDRAGLKEEDLARNLTQELQSGSMQGSLQAWSSCGDSGDKSALLKCLEQIATESVQDACKYAYTDAQGNRVADGEDLDEAYYTSRAQVVRGRLAAGGARLAAILKCLGVSLRLQTMVAMGFCYDGLQAVRKRNVLVVGRSQVGKSHLCNVLCGRTAFRSEGRKDEHTRIPREETFEFWDEVEDMRYEVTLIDTPGISGVQAEGGWEAMMDQLVDIIESSPVAIHRIFYVAKLRPFRGEEVRCLQTLRDILSDKACGAGICSLVVTHCDWLEERQELVEELYLQSGALAHFPGMFRKDFLQGEPEALAVDFSSESPTLLEDRGLLLQSILRATAPISKTRLYRLFAGTDSHERGPMRRALMEHLLPELA